MMAALVSTMIVAASLPREPWSVGPDGKTCVQLEQGLLRELSTWHEDPENTAVEEGVFGRVHPQDGQKLVLLFASREACERIVWAMQQKAREDGPRHVLEVEEIRERLADHVRAASVAAMWKKTSATQQKNIIDELKELFAGWASRHRALAAMRRMNKEGQNKRTAAAARRSAALRLQLARRLFVDVFGEAADLSVVEKRPADKLADD